MYVEAMNQVSQLTLRVRIVVEPDEGGFHAYCPAFKGLHIGGTTQKEAFDNAVEAARVYLNSLAATNEGVPIGPYCQSVQDHQELPHIPVGALSQDAEILWPSHKRYGTR
jgi:predicted RNase H-like HicB family nuclease